jgi:hypothetical protein
VAFPCYDENRFLKGGSNMFPIPGSHADYHFSVTVQTDDLALLGCLRALSAHVQTVGNNRIPWGGTKETDWERDKHQATFHFSDPQIRESFLAEAQRLLPTGLWNVVSQNDADPASRQSD